MKTPSKTLQASRVLIAAAAALIGSQTSIAHADQTWSWNFNGGAAWNDATRWTQNSGSTVGTFPNQDILAGTGLVTANFRNNVSAADKTITGINNYTIANLNIGDNNGTTKFILGASTDGGLIFDSNNSEVAATLTQAATSNGDIINAPIKLASSLNVRNLFNGTGAPNSNALTLNGTISSATAGLKTLKITSDSISNIAISSITNGSGQVALVVEGMVALNGANTYNGGTTLNAGGTLRVHNASALGAANSLLTVNGGTIENVSGSASANNTWNTYQMQWNGSFAFSTSSVRTINTGNGGITLGADITITQNNLNTVTIGGVISGNHSLTFTQGIGTSTLTLGGANAYTGGTTVGANTTVRLASAGTIGTGDLSVSGSLDMSGRASASYSLTAMQTVSGDGTIIIGSGKTLILNGSISPGVNTAVETLTFENGALELTSTTTFEFTLGTLSDQIALTGGGTLALGVGVIDFTDFNFTAGDGFGVGTYTLIGGAASLTGSLGEDLSGEIGGFGSTLSLSGNDLVLTVVPEPRIVALAMVGLLGLVLMHRHRTARGA